jgi:Hypoxia induced protein conserved region
MSFLTLMVIVAMVATIAALALGVSSMVRDGEVGHLDSEHWMAIRVFLQATTC